MWTLPVFQHLIAMIAVATIVAIQPESAFIADARDCPLTRGALAGGWAWCGRRSAAVLWGRGCGREPGGVGAPLASGGQVGLDDREVGQSEQGAPGPAGGALLHLDRADVPFGLI